MKVKDLIKLLSGMPQDSYVFVDLRQSENGLNINKVSLDTYKCGDADTKVVNLVADWTDFKLNEEEAYCCEQDLDEMARQDAIDAMIDQALGK